MQEPIFYAKNIKNTRKLVLIELENIRAIEKTLEPKSSNLNRIKIGFMKSKI